MGKNSSYFKSVIDNQKKKGIKDEIKEEDELDEKKDSGKNSEDGMDNSVSSNEDESVSKTNKDWRISYVIYIFI